MFTGIVEDLGKIEYIRSNKICIRTGLRDILEGDSVMVDGVCLTVSAVRLPRITMDIGVVTRSKTAFKRLGPGSFVNLERSLSLGDRIGGHFVYGHVMAVGRVISNRITANTRIISIKADRSFLSKLMLKGSVTVNGVSLTVNEIKKDFLKVGIVPETAQRTNLGKISSSDIVNLEADMMVAAVKEGNK